MTNTRCVAVTASNYLIFNNVENMIYLSIVCSCVHPTYAVERLALSNVRMCVSIIMLLLFIESETKLDDCFVVTMRWRSRGLIYTHQQRLLHTLWSRWDIQLNAAKHVYLSSSNPGLAEISFKIPEKDPLFLFRNESRDELLKRDVNSFASLSR